MAQRKLDDARRGACADRCHGADNHQDDPRPEGGYRPDYAVLLLATYELQKKSVPVAVVVNEAVELSKKYGTDKSGAFVNGVLAKVAKDLN